MISPLSNLLIAANFFSTLTTTFFRFCDICMYVHSDVFSLTVEAQLLNSTSQPRRTKRVLTSSCVFKQKSSDRKLLRAHRIAAKRHPFHPSFSVLSERTARLTRSARI